MMKNKNILVFILLCVFSTVTYAKKGKVEKEISDREYWAQMAYKIAAPVLSNMSEGLLKQNMLVELSPTWDGRNKNVTYMECIGRLMAGIAPWLSLPDDDTEEGKMRRQLREWALKSYAHAVNPDSPDYLLWRNEGQPLVDAAYIASSFLRAKKQLWEPIGKRCRKVMPLILQKFGSSRRKRYRADNQNQKVPAGYLRPKPRVSNVPRRRKTNCSSVI